MHHYMDPIPVKMGRMYIGKQEFRTAIRVGAERAATAKYILDGIYWSIQRYTKADDELERHLNLEPNAKDADKTRKSIDDLRKKVS